MIFHIEGHSNNYSNKSEILISTFYFFNHLKYETSSWYFKMANIKSVVPIIPYSKYCSIIKDHKIMTFTFIAIRLALNIENPRIHISYHNFSIFYRVSVLEMDFFRRLKMTGKPNILTCTDDLYVAKRWTFWYLCLPLQKRKGKYEKS